MSELPPAVRRWQTFISASDWPTLVVPILTKQFDYFSGLLRQPPEIRSPKLSDDYCRAAMDAFEFLLVWPRDQVNSALADAAQEIMVRQLEGLYHGAEEAGTTPVLED